jgi:hypothetical protein
MAGLRRLWIQLTADRRRFTVLCCTFGVGMLLWARIIVISNHPRTAIADGPDADASVDPEAGTRSDKPRPVIPLSLAARPGRDPFAVNVEFFPRPASADGLIPDGGKSGHQPAEDPQLAERRLVARYRAVVDRMDLEAVMTGVNMAVINGRTYRLGDQVAGADGEPIRFSLVQVRQRSVVLEVEGRRFDLRMTSPEG